MTNLHNDPNGLNTTESGWDDANIVVCYLGNGQYRLSPKFSSDSTVTTAAGLLALADFLADHRGELEAALQATEA